MSQPFCWMVAWTPCGRYFGRENEELLGPRRQYAHVYAPIGHIWLQPRPLHTSTDVAVQLFSREQATQQILFKVSIFQYNCT